MQSIAQRLYRYRGYLWLCLVVFFLAGVLFQLLPPDALRIRISYAGIVLGLICAHLLAASALFSSPLRWPAEKARWWERLNLALRRYWRYTLFFVWAVLLLVFLSFLGKVVYIGIA